MDPVIEFSEDLIQTFLYHFGKKGCFKIETK